MLNLYVPIGKVKLAMRITDNRRDEVLGTLIEDVCRDIDAASDRHFYSVTATRVYDSSGKTYLLLPDDLLSVTTLKLDEDGDGVYETTLVASTDYWLSQDGDPNTTPYTRIDLNPRSTLATAFPYGRRRVQIVGVFGYSAETETCGTVAEAIDASETEWTMTAGHGLSGGETLITPSGEQVAVQSVDNDVLTVVRAVNGTTAATLAQNDAVTRRRYERTIERAVMMQAARWNRDSQSGGASSSSGQDFGGGLSSSLYPAIRDLITRHRKQAVA